MKKIILLLFLTLTTSALAQSTFTLGQKVLASSRDGWRPAKIIGILEGGIYRVRLNGSEQTETNLSLDSLKPVQTAHTYRDGERVLVDWNSSQFEADIMGWSERGYRIHYVGYSSSYDEWADPSRVHPNNTIYYWHAGDKVQVLWGAKWYDALIVNANSYSNYVVHYEGWESDFDETVSYTRVRAR